MLPTKFGKVPSGERFEIIQRSPNYRDGKFQNIHFTPDLTEGVSYYTVTKDFFCNKSKRNKPVSVLPSQKIDLKAIGTDENILVWFGHSSYYMQVDGKRILVDPVLSGNASPISFGTRSFNGSDVYSPPDFPDIDYLFISHDHWDHLDYETVMDLKLKIKQIITGLGVGAHFTHWGFDKNIIIEKDWNQEINLGGGFIVTTAPGRHFSGRGLKRNQSIWSGFILQTPTMKLFLGGDSGYDTHFADIGKKHGPFDIALLECGQYNQYWKYIHMMPEETVQAAIDLKARRLMPVHWAKFSLSLHDWDEPIKRITAEAARRNVPIITPMIGQQVNLNEDDTYPAWWVPVD